MAAKASAAKKVIPILPELTADEVQAAKAACSKARRMAGASRAADKARDAALAQIFFKMGFANFDEVKALSPERISAEIQKRAGVAFSFESADAREFAILKTWEGRFPAWKDQLIARVGPAIASEIEESTKKQFCYAIVDAPIGTLPQPNVIYIPKRVK